MLGLAQLHNQFSSQRLDVMKMMDEIICNIIIYPNLFVAWANGPHIVPQKRPAQ